jgi:ribonucleotide reductase beta subunit family protein with ferritin-like domain
VALAIVEGIFFSGSFCAIYRTNERGKLPGLAKADEFIARDEGIHVDFACLLYNKYIARKLTQQ